jgi:hypothetical protein
VDEGAHGLALNAIAAPFSSRGLNEATQPAQRESRSNSRLSRIGNNPGSMAAKLLDTVFVNLWLQTQNFRSRNAPVNVNHRENRLEAPAFRQGRNCEPSPIAVAYSATLVCKRCRRSEQTGFSRFSSEFWREAQS